MGRPRKFNNYLVDIIRKEKYKIRVIYDDHITFNRYSSKPAHAVLEVIRPNTRKRISLFLAARRSRYKNIVKKMPFRMQFVIPYFYQAKILQQKYNVRNPVDEFVEVVDVTWSDFEKAYCIAIKFIDNVRFVRMMHDWNKGKGSKKKRVKNTTRTQRKSKRRKLR